MSGLKFTGRKAEREPEPPASSGDSLLAADLAAKLNRWQQQLDDVIRLIAEDGELHV